MTPNVLAAQQCLNLLAGHCWQELHGDVTPRAGAARVCRHCDTKEVWVVQTIAEWRPAS